MEDQVSSNQGSSIPKLTITTMNSTSTGTRHLPSREVSDDSFDEAYASFIMWCNPAVPMTTDTSELKKTFRSPPKSDGRTFSPFTLFGLVRSLELKQLKTWAQLVIELGVEPPLLEKGQSAQKVQQYAVRLKRWMRSMHVDAFYEYLLEKEHIYWSHVPNVFEPPSEFGRDGVLPEEDLALRALLPETKPKRGRKRADEKDTEADSGPSSAQRPRLHSPMLAPDSSGMRRSLLHDSTSMTSHPANASFHRDMPHSAHPLSNVSADHWPNSHHLPEPHHNDDDTPYSAFPHSAYPQSAFLPRDVETFNHRGLEPQSAITPSRSKNRRRHGLGVSSAWLASGVGGGKPRGRPPANSTTSDGPFSTFPANPLGPARSNSNSQNSENGQSLGPTIYDSIAANASSVAVEQQSRPTRQNLPHLQVPERAGGPVRLATPPTNILAHMEQRGREQEPQNLQRLEASFMSRMDRRPGDITEWGSSMQSSNYPFAPPSLGGEHPPAARAGDVGVTGTVYFADDSNNRSSREASNRTITGTNHSSEPMKGATASHLVSLIDQQNKELETLQKHMGERSRMLEQIKLMEKELQDQQEPVMPQCRQQPHSPLPISNPKYQSTPSPIPPTPPNLPPPPPPPSTTTPSAQPHQEEETNVTALTTACAHLLLSAHWFSTTGTDTPPCSLNESMLLSKRLINDICNEAPSAETFLLALCSLSGATTLLSPGSLRITRLERDERTRKFSMKWQLKFGGVVGNYVKLVELSESALGTTDVSPALAPAVREAESNSGGGGGPSKSRNETPAVKEHVGNNIEDERVRAEYERMVKSIAKKERRLVSMRNDILAILIRNDSS